MIISKTPLRVSFVGGGSDISTYYKHHQGKVVSTTIDKYIYVTVNSLSEYFECKYLLKYSKTEMCNEIDEIQHPIIRETLRKLNITDRVEITSMADLPAGTGLGSSSSYTVGLLNALYVFKGKYVSKEILAQEACEIEIDILKEPIGKQDQYAASYGGFSVIEFNKDESVSINPVITTQETKSALNDKLLMFYTGKTRLASDILTEQKARSKDDQRVIQTVSFMVDQCVPLLESISNGVSLTEVGYILHRSWNYKKSLVDSISDSVIDNYYWKALESGCIGGKLLGAGAGGCLLFFAERQNHDRVRNTLNDLKEVKFKFENEGTKIIYFSD
jgi:D-glycero-alpha-D-manno-heptose-7-phosphate kinase